MVLVDFRMNVVHMDDCGTNLSGVLLLRQYDLFLTKQEFLLVLVLNVTFARSAAHCTPPLKLSETTK